MRVIKNVLEEELESSLRQQAAYIQEINSIPKGVLVRKEIRGHVYYYLMFRENGKVKFVYKGKLSKEKIDEFEKAKLTRVKYRKLLADIKKQISFLKKALNAKEIRSI